MEYLKKGEKEVCRIEDQICSYASRVYNELATPNANTLLNLLKSKDNLAVVVLDGLSLREIPILLKLAANTGYHVESCSTNRAALPSETMDFVSAQLGLKGVAPSQLPSRKELKAENIAVFYLNSETNWIRTPVNNSNILIWSSFPDHTYTDSGARFASHFEHIAARMKNVWMSSVQQIPAGYEIIITSDHGYIFFDSGTSFDLNNRDKLELNRFFGNDRNKKVEPGIIIPDLKYIHHLTEQDIAIIKGRVRSVSTGKAASIKYKHGGLSLMEMVTPWIELKKD
ncbi:MAG: hypothetical protein H8D23_29475 [Candidatus Brocadiales bacterium]|nr:hypothetical protein [Candidatus Brocadiales bacterium]